MRKKKQSSHKLFFEKIAAKRNSDHDMGIAVHMTKKTNVGWWNGRMMF